MTDISITKRAKLGIFLPFQYQNILNYIVPDFVHIFQNGNIIQSDIIN